MPTTMAPPDRVGPEQREYLQRIAGFLSKVPWGAEYYRAQIALIARLEALEKENRFLRGLVPPGVLPDGEDPVTHLARLVEPT